ncbi:MAG TPA: FadR/GntR family transcriptional regulator [Terrimesophilobacter sp.]|nr:FadR/GntR family transcriptional regulator [Terrimesophilobacter sp.]HRP99031.1 FadR/GntR family transcriptional regulator [Terrimesophilobacter sp.]
MAKLSTGNHHDFRPVKALSASLAAVQQLEMMVSTGSLRPGDRLPPERELAQFLQISRPTLREAIRALRLMGLVESQQGRGTFIAPDAQATHRPSSTVSPQIELDRADVQQIVEVRAAIESGLARLAASRIDEDQLQKFAQILETMASTAEKHKLLQLDIELHELVASASGNAPLTEYLASNKKIISVARSRTMEVLKVRQRIIADQERIYLALKNGDSREAGEAMWDHLSGVIDSYMVGSN